MLCLIVSVEERLANVLVGIKNVLGLLSERFSDSPQHNLVFMTAKANHTVKYQTYLH